MKLLEKLNGIDCTFTPCQRGSQELLPLNHHRYSFKNNTQSTFKR